MHLRSEDDPSRADRMCVPTFQSDAFGTRSERVRQIRQNIADDLYRSVEVVDTMARRILMSGDL